MFPRRLFLRLLLQDRILEEVDFKCEEGWFGVPVRDSVEDRLGFGRSSLAEEPSRALW
jgi:hypothetical protein